MDEQVHSVLVDLESLALQREELETAWQATASVIEVLLWCDEFSRAAAWSERTIHDLGQRQTGLNDQLIPFSAAFMAADLYAGESAVSRLRSAAAELPADSELGSHLARVADNVQESSSSEALSGRRPWDEGVRKLGRRQRDLVEQDWDSLSRTDFDGLWMAVRRSNDFALAQRLVVNTGRYPTRWPPVIWFAQWLVHDGQLDEAARALVESKNVYIPFAPWAFLPDTPPVNPTLRPAVTSKVRSAFLSDVRNPFPLEQS